MPRIFTFRLTLAVLICLLPCTRVFSQISYDRILQVNGVIMTSDSLMGISDVTVTVKNQNKGTYSSPLGVFSLVCFKGDTLQFSALGFKDKEVPLSGDINTNTISMVQLMSQDTFFLNETIIHFLPSRENFNYVFQNFQVPDDKYEIARRNSNLATIRMMSLMMNRDGRESQHAVQNDQAYRAAYSGQQTPQNIMNPLKWAEFIDSWKRGDYRKKKNQ